MNLKLTTILSIVVLLLATINANAQRADKSDYKSFAKQEKVLTKKTKDKAAKEARKEAKKLTKDGYAVPAGKLSLAKQIEKAWQAQYTMNQNGLPYYIVSTARSISGSHSAAAMQANNLAKLELVGQIETRIAQIIENKVASEELGKDEAASIVSTVSAAKSIISNTLSVIIPFVEVYKVLPNRNIEVMVTIGYSSDLAMQEAIKAVKNNLGDEASELMDRLEVLIGE